MQRNILFENLIEIYSKDIFLIIYKSIFVRFREKLNIEVQKLFVQHEMLLYNSQ